jgi:hypothetical protein
MSANGKAYKKEKRRRKPPLLSFLDKLFLALGAGNGDLAFASGNTHYLMAPGAIVIAVLPVFDPIQQLQIFPVFLVALVGIPGEAAENGPEQQAVGQQAQQHIQKIIFGKKSDEAQCHTGQQNGGIEFVRAIAAHHKTAEAYFQFFSKLAKPAAESIHLTITLP